MQMTINYSDQDLILPDDRPSIFLVGPTACRDHRRPAQPGESTTWRPDALAALTKAGFTGVVYVPERSNGNNPDFEFEPQATWELAALEHTSVIAAWVPRVVSPDLVHFGMPGFTTNVEFGFWLATSPDRLLYGRPDWAHNVRYLDFLYKRQTGRAPITTLEEMMARAAELANHNHAQARAS